MKLKARSSHVKTESVKSSTNLVRHTFQRSKLATVSTEIKLRQRSSDPFLSPNQIDDSIRLQKGRHLQPLSLDDQWWYSLLLSSLTTGLMSPPCGAQTNCSPIPTDGRAPWMVWGMIRDTGALNRNAFIHLLFSSICSQDPHKQEKFWIHHPWFTPHSMQNPFQIYVISPLKPQCKTCSSQHFRLAHTLTAQWDSWDQGKIISTAPQIRVKFTEGVCSPVFPNLI